MDKSTLAKMMFTVAKKDMFMGKGRVIPGDFLRHLGNPKVTITNLILAWQETYPYFPIEQKMNVLIINFEV